MASYKALREKWVDAEGKVEPIQFEGASIFFLLICVRTAN
jgi:hypothetical protein